MLISIRMVGPSERSAGTMISTTFVTEAPLRHALYAIVLSALVSVHPRLRTGLNLGSPFPVAGGTFDLQTVRTTAYSCTCGPALRSACHFGWPSLGASPFGHSHPSILLDVLVNAGMLHHHVSSFPMAPACSVSWPYYPQVLKGIPCMGLSGRQASSLHPGVAPTIR